MDKKRGACMKKKIILLSIFAVYLLSSQVFADSISQIGKKVSGEASVYLNGVKIKDAIIVNNASYAPIRPIAEALNVDVAFEKNEKGSAINLTSPETKEVTKEMIWKKAEIQTKITSANREIERLNQENDYATKQLETATHEILVKTLERSISEAKQQIIDAQANIITYTNELLELESSN